MSKLKGSYKSADNIEVITSHPLDPRVRWDSWDSLTNVEDWPKNQSGSPYLYSGIIVSVNESTVSGEYDWKVYVLNNISGWNIPYGEEGSGWRLVGDGQKGQEIFWEDETETE